MWDENASSPKAMVTSRNQRMGKNAKENRAATQVDSSDRQRFCVTDSRDPKKVLKMCSAGKQISSEPQ